MDHIGFVYCWTNIINGMKYIGSHYGTVTDGYVASGRKFLNAYNKNPDNFERTILEYIHEGTVTDVRTREQHYLDLVENIDTDPMYYNLTSRAAGWPTLIFKRRREGVFTEGERRAHYLLNNGINRNKKYHSCKKGAIAAGKIKGERIRSGFKTIREDEQYTRRKEGRFTENELLGFQRMSERMRERHKTGLAKPPPRGHRTNKVWIAEFSDGSQLRITNLRLYCEENNLSYHYIKNKKSHNGVKYFCTNEKGS